MDVMEAIILGINQLHGKPLGLRVSLPVWDALLNNSSRKMAVWVEDVRHPKGRTPCIQGLPVALDQNTPSDGLCVVGDNETVMVLNLDINQGDKTDGKK